MPHPDRYQRPQHADQPKNKIFHFSEPEAREARRTLCRLRCAIARTDHTTRLTYTAWPKYFQGCLSFVMKRRCHGSVASTVRWCGLMDAGSLSCSMQRGRRPSFNARTASKARTAFKPRIAFKARIAITTRIRHAPRHTVVL